MKRLSSCRAGVRLLCLFASLLAAARAADDAPVAPGVVELPKFVVTDNRELPQPESWRYATIPGFEILTNASDKSTARFIREFELFRQALGFVWPGIQPRTARPASLIITGKGGKFDAFVPAEKYDAALSKASLFLKKGEQTAIVIDFQATTLNVLAVDTTQDAATGTDSSLISVEHDKLLYREYVRFLLSRNEPRPPAWLEEGLCQIIMKMRFEKRYLEYARIEDPGTISAEAGMVMAAAAANAAAGVEGDTTAFANAPAEDRDFNAALQRKRLVPLDQFFALKHDAPEARNPLGNNIWAKQAYAFVHMCLYGYKGKYQKPFTAFLARAMREPVTEQLFKECFNMTYAKMLLEIRSYCDFTVYDAKVIQSKKGGPDVLIDPPALVLRDATQSEIGRIKGEALVLAGHEKKARTELIAPYQRGERDPNLLASLGLYEQAAGEHARARKFLEAAVKEKVVRAEAYLELARYQLDDALGQPAGGEGRLSAAQTAPIVALLEMSRKQAPQAYGAYELLGETWTRTVAVPTRENAVGMIDGVQMFPGRLKLAYQAAIVCSKAGLLEPAHTLADHGLKYAPDATAKGRFEALKKSLPPAPPAPAAGAPAPKK